MSSRARTFVHVFSGALIAVACFLAFVLPAYMTPTDRLDGAYTCAAILWLLGSTLQHARLRAEGTVLSDFGIRQRTVFGDTTLSWAEITSVRIGAGRLVLRRRLFERIVVPYNLFKDPDGLVRYVAERVPAKAK